MEQSLPTEERTKSPYHITNSNKKNYWIELDIRDDPMNPERRIFFFYDVTEIYDLRNQLIENPEFHGIIGKSRSITELKSRIYDFARINWTVLIEGETGTGTGKELVVRAIHHTSDRRDKPFIAVNTAGLSESLLESQLFGHTRGAFTGAVSDQKGLFETADKGTLFLDEIGDISPQSTDQPASCP